jgi:predicted transposase/invertase (TIGR01784 family)
MAGMTEKFIDILSPKNDFVFKQLFGDAKDIDPLAAFLQAALGLREEEFDKLTIVDPNLNPEYDDDKHCILDVRVRTRSGREIDVEIQAKPTEDICNRIQYYTAKMVAGQVKAGESYGSMPQSVTIVIADFRMWETDARYHHRFLLHDSVAELAYPNSMEIHTLELPKLPDDSDGTKLWDWLKFIASETRDEFESLAGKDAVMAKAYGTLMKLSADEKMRLRAEAHEKWAWDNNSRMRQSRREGLLEGRKAEKTDIARRMLRTGMPLAEVAQLADCTVAEIEELAAENNAQSTALR